MQVEVALFESFGVKNVNSNGHKEYILLIPFLLIGEHLECEKPVMCMRRKDRSPMQSGPHK